MLSLEQVDSRELMVRAKTGDPDAFPELYTRYRRYVLAIAARCYPGHADDIAQEAWARALRGLHNWHDRGIDPAAWLGLITRNIARDRAKSAYEQLVDVVGAMPERAAEPERTDPALLIGDHLARRDLKAALALLTPDQRDVLLAYYLGEMSVTEIAAQMGQTAGSVKSLLFRGRRAMARQLVSFESLENA